MLSVRISESCVIWPYIFLFFATVEWYTLEVTQCHQKQNKAAETFFCAKKRFITWLFSRQICLRK